MSRPTFTLTPLQQENLSLLKDYTWKNRSNLSKSEFNSVLHAMRSVREFGDTKQRAAEKARSKYNINQKFIEDMLTNLGL